MAQPAVETILADEADIIDQTVLRLQNDKDVRLARADRMLRKRTHAQLVTADGGHEREQAIRHRVRRFLDDCRVPRTPETYSIQQSPADIFTIYLAWSSKRSSQLSPPATFDECEWYFREENMLPVGSTVVQL